jgi:mannose-6-phosphate isomerase-like protein (cupin superfamily)
MSAAARIPTKYPKGGFVARSGLPNCRSIVAPAPGGWTEPALFEWELRAESWTDEHPHTEYNYVIEGLLFVEAGGVTVEAGAGDTIQVPPGAVGKYWAPVYARMLAIYGPSEGGASRKLSYEKI